MAAARRRRHGVRDRQDRRTGLRQHAHYAGQLQRLQRRSPYAGLIADANGDLFGTTRSGGANDDGTVFEIANTAHRLRQHPDHAGQLQRRQRCSPMPG